MSVKNAFLRFFISILIFQIPSLVSAQQQSPVDVALRYLEQNQKELNLTTDDIRDFRVSDLYTSRHNGVTHVYLNQEYENVRVLNAIINVNILPNGEVLNIGNRFVSHLKEKVNGANPSITPEMALQKVIDLYNINIKNPIKLQSKVDDQHFIFDQTGMALEPVSVKLVYQTTENKFVRLAWMVQLYQLDGQHWWNARIDASSGELIIAHDQVIHCEFDHPDASCIEHDHSASPKITHKTESLNTILDLNSYNVFPMPVQSPNHGNRQLVSDPSNVVASPFGWHDTDGATGPDFTITRGNNVHAYHDIFSNNTSSGDEPDGGASLDFDFPLDLSTGLPYSQIDPAVTNLFYWNNIIHDLWYQYGFDEVSGNFQLNNYNNGGVDGDWVRAEALDGGGTNNANFGTGEDGTNARMQMFVWTNDPLPGGTGNPDLIVTDPADIAGTYAMQQATFGAPLPSPAIVSEVVLVDDGVDVGSDACQDITNGAAISGFIALIDRGECEFGEKVLKAETEGAIAVIVCNNVANDGTFAMGPGDFGNQVTIPSVMISFEDCITLKTGLPGLTVEFGAGMIDIPMPGPTGFDGDFDNGIIVHEYGHGISIRLTGGPSTGGCLFDEEQAGEGWSDWFALVMTTTSANNPEESRGIGTYAVGQATTGDGIREFPYSRDMSINEHTYGDVPDVAVPHGVGSVWCAMIWDLYWNMVDEYGFDDDIYNGTGGNNMTMQLVIDGLKLQACGPSFIDSRDAILMADQANYNGVNQCLIWETFARRGLGWSASAGGNQAFDIPAFCTPVQVIKTAPEEIIAGETITYSLEIINNLPSLLSNIVVNDEFPAGTSYVEGSLSCTNGTVNNDVLTIDVGSLDSESSITCTYQLLVDDAPFSFIELEDDVENGEENWTISSPIGDAFWETNTSSFEGDLAWFAEDIDSESDQYLVLSGTLNLEGDSPALIFWHWYDTEATWDGGVVEVSTNGGNTWDDLGDNMVQNGYNGTLEVNPASPISGRDAFNGDSDGYIQTIIDLSEFSGDDIAIRFRFGCDGAAGGNGWYVDNIQFFGNLYSITNTACASTNGADSNCDDATTVVFGDEMTATDDLNSAFKFSISPNPTNGKFILSMESISNSPANIQIMSVDGRLLQVRTIDHADGAFEFDLSDAAPGVYLLQIQTDEALVTKKIVVE